MGNRLYIVVPCYNEEQVLLETAGRLRAKICELVSAGKVAENSRVLFVDDGSKDGTWRIVSELARGEKVFAGISLSRNRGHQNALFAGLMEARTRADMAISMDADLQDDIGAVDRMVDLYLEGCDVVYGVRSSRGKDAFFKRLTAQGYYRLLQAMGCKVVFDHADFRLLSRRALDALAEYGEQNLFLRGIVPMLGFRSAVVEYERGERFAGESKYPLKKMLSLAADGVASLSLKPLRLVTWLGALMLVFALALLVRLLAAAASGGADLGWRAAVTSVWGVGGLLMVSLGVVGEYVGRAYMEAKGRPRYHIWETVGLD